MADPTITDFVEKRFPEEINFGFTGGPVFFTQIASTQGGFEQRQINWAQAKHNFIASHEVKTQIELDALRDFFFAVRGQGSGFRFFDWNDYCTDMPNQIGTVPLFTLGTSGTLTPQPMVNTVNGSLGIGDGSTLIYQASKVYTPEAPAGEMDYNSGATTISFATSTTITRSAGSFITDGFVEGQTLYAYGSPNSANDGTLGVLTTVVAGTLTISTASFTTESTISDVRLFSQTIDVAPFVRELKKTIAVRPFVDSVEYTEGGGATGYAVDHNTGLVTFNVGPPAGVIVEIDALFDVPVRFDSDEFLARLNHFNVGDVANIQLTELRIA